MKVIEEIKKMSTLPIEERVEKYNKISSALKEMVGINFPVVGVQLVPLESVQANDYNPNKVAKPEMKLLELSIRKDGLTMPVVVANDGKNKGKYIVVDGFHRTTVTKNTDDIRERSKGYLPVSFLDKNIEDRITATVRHNVARGTHQVELTAHLVTLLKKHNWSNERIGTELGMQPDEVLRLKQITGLAEMFADEEFSKSWE